MPLAANPRSATRRITHRVPSLSTLFVDQRVPRETAPGLKVRADNRFAASYGQEISRAALAKRTDKFGQQTTAKRFIASVELNVRWDWHMLLNRI